MTNAIDDLKAAVDRGIARLEQSRAGRAAVRKREPDQSESVLAALHRIADERAAERIAANRKAAPQLCTPPSAEYVARVVAAMDARQAASSVAAPPAHTAAAKPPVAPRHSISQGLRAIFAAVAGREPSDDSEAAAAFEAAERAPAEVLPAPETATMSTGSSLLNVHLASRVTPTIQKDYQ